MRFLPLTLAVLHTLISCSQAGTARSDCSETCPCCYSLVYLALPDSPPSRSRGTGRETCTACQGSGLVQHEDKVRINSVRHAGEALLPVAEKPTHPPSEAWVPR